MAETNPSAGALNAGRIGDFLAARRGILRDYLATLGGSAGRLVFSLGYFVALANTLSIADFGLFATASAAGVMLSRLLAFGFVSTLYRVATMRPLLLGTYTAGFLLLALASLPLLALAAAGTYAVFFSSTMPAAAFTMVIVAEALLWRPAEVAIVVANGMGQFGRAATVVVLGTVARALAAVAFMAWPSADLASWAGFYIAANVVSLAIAVGGLYPRQRLRFRFQLYWGRLADSLYVALAEVLFYLQMELDKLLVLSAGGAELAGIYAIVMRLVDLTAIPIRSFTMMLVQRIMRVPGTIARLRVKVGIELGVLLVSTAAMATLALVLSLFPHALGKNIAQAAPLVGLALMVPGFRNLVEYQAELLFARGQTLLRAVNLGLLAALKGALLWLVLVHATSTFGMVLLLNPAFAALYVASASLTYSALRRPSKAL